MLYAAILAFDIGVLINFTFHIFREHNFDKFGWVFTFVLFGVPYLAPVYAIMSAIMGSEKMLRISGNLNSMTVCFNYLLTFFACYISADDLMYLIMLGFMFLFKSILSAITAKIRMYLSNPRYGWNEEALGRIF